MKQKPLQKKSYLLPSLVGITGLTSLCFSSIFILIPQIQNNLAQQIKESLSQANIEADIIVSGRDITLTGKSISPDSINLATKKTMEIRGVNSITNNIGMANTNKLKVTAKNEPIPAVEIDTPAEDRLTDPIEDIPNNTLNIDSISSISPTESKVSVDTKEDTENEKIIEDLNNIITNGSTLEPTDNKQSKPLRRGLDYDTLLTAVNNSLKVSTNNTTKAPTTNLKLSSKLDTSKILFDSNNKKQLSSSSEKSLNNFATELQESLERFDIIVSEKSSQTALEQARIIRNYLVSRGIKKSRMNIIGRENTQYQVQIRPSS